jgi:hypothetical protein
MTDYAQVLFLFRCYLDLHSTGRRGCVVWLLRQELRGRLLCLSVWPLTAVQPVRMSGIPVDFSPPTSPKVSSIAFPSHV